jgi:hypothetical protein
MRASHWSSGAAQLQAQKRRVLGIEQYRCFGIK